MEKHGRPPIVQPNLEPPILLKRNKGPTGGMETCALPDTESKFTVICKDFLILVGLNASTGFLLILNLR